MLKPGHIPDREPFIRVGIVLPEDNISSLTLETYPGTKFSSGNKESDIKGTITIRSDGNHIISGNIKTGVLKLNHPGEKAHITVNQVVAGRGFHWSKKIDVKLRHTIEIRSVNGNILLINELPLEEYLACVATSEMSASCPSVYVEAQTIVARSWMLANVEQKHRHLGFDVCNDDCCQRYQGINNLTPHSHKAALNTKGIVLFYENEIVDARYSKSCGGVMERYENLWDNNPKEYMQNKTDANFELATDLTREDIFNKWVNSIPATFCSPHFIKEEELHGYLGNVDESGKYFRWTIETTQEELTANINRNLNLNASAILHLLPLQRAGSGRLLKLKIVYFDVNKNKKDIVIHKDYNIRKVLHKKFLYSSAITIKDIKGTDKTIPEKFIFKGAGWGHGAGMCQIGALGMSLAGYDTEQIVMHYYPGAVLKKLY